MKQVMAFKINHKESRSIHTSISYNTSYIKVNKERPGKLLHNDKILNPATGNNTSKNM